jgi:hypothetical protein
MPQPQNPSFREQYATAQWLMRFPALTVMVFLRRDLGYRLLNPAWLIAGTGFLFVITVLTQPHTEGANPIDLLFFVLGALILGIYQRVKRWRELNRGIPQHSYYIGTSPFDYRWLPMFCRRNRRMARLADPIFCALIGLAVFPCSRALAMWLVFSGFCLRSLEYAVHQKQRNRDLDTIDGLINAEIQSETVEHFERPTDAQQQPASGIPTGLGEDIQNQIKRKKQNNLSLN